MSKKYTIVYDLKKPDTTNTTSVSNSSQKKTKQYGGKYRDKYLISGPVSCYHLEFGHATIILFGDIHRSEEGICDSCYASKPERKCYTVDRLLQLAALKGIDLFLESTYKEKNRSYIGDYVTSDMFGKKIVGYLSKTLKLFNACTIPEKKFCLYDKSLIHYVDVRESMLLENVGNAIRMALSLLSTKKMFTDKLFWNHFMSLFLVKIKDKPLNTKFTDVIIDLINDSDNGLFNMFKIGERENDFRDFMKIVCTICFICVITVDQLKKMIHTEIYAENREEQYNEILFGGTIHNKEFMEFMISGLHETNRIIKQINKVPEYRTKINAYFENEINKIDFIKYASARKNILNIFGIGSEEVYSGAITQIAQIVSKIMTLSDSNKHVIIMNMSDMILTFSDIGMIGMDMYTISRMLYRIENGATKVFQYSGNEHIVNINNFFTNFLSATTKSEVSATMMSPISPRDIVFSESMKGGYRPGSISHPTPQMIYNRCIPCPYYDFLENIFEGVPPMKYYEILNGKRRKNVISGLISTLRDI
jgi:hypothetical protein